MAKYLWTLGLFFAVLPTTVMLRVVRQQEEDGTPSKMVRRSQQGSRRPYTQCLKEKVSTYRTQLSVWKDGYK